MIEILAASLISNLLIYIYGCIFIRYFFTKNFSYNENFAENSIFGIIFICFIALIINFFIPLNKIVGTVIIIIAIIPGFFIIQKINNKNKFFLFLFYNAFITIVLLYASNVNRPDAGLYHLPYTSLINENKIIIGSANIHFRFGHISIIQYLSAIYNNYLFNTSSITLPLASIFSIFLIFSIKKISEHLKSGTNQVAFVIFLILIYSIYSFNRYSSYGNDMSSHIYFFILCIFFLELKNIKSCSAEVFFKISLICIFLITLKTFMTIVALIPLILFINYKKKLNLFTDPLFIVLSLFLFSWLFRNLLSSGCIIYPLQISCIDNLIYSNIQQTENEQLSGEAWAKGWSDQKNLVLPYEKYIKNFNWVGTWTSVHLKQIYTKFVPFVVFLFFVFFWIVIKNFYSQRLIRKEKKIEQSFYILFFLSLFFSTIWFLKFPLYRYGQSFLAILFILIFFLFFLKFLNIENRQNFQNLYKTIISIALILFCLKNFIRINKDSIERYNHYPWPKIYTYKQDNNFQKDFKLLKNNNEKLYYYSDGELCMYSKSPCSAYKLDNLHVKKIFNYSIYFFNKNLK
jgi:hypothetical protein